MFPDEYILFHACITSWKLVNLVVRLFVLLVQGSAASLTLKVLQTVKIKKKNRL